MSKEIKFGSNNDVKDYSEEKQSYIIDSLEGEDFVRTREENDVIRGGLGKDELYTKGGEDVIVLVGETKKNEYYQSDIKGALEAVLRVDGMDDKDSLNDRKQSESVRGEIIDGGEGEAALVIYGRVDLRGLEVKNVERLIVNSELILNEKHLMEFLC